MANPFANSLKFWGVQWAAFAITEDIAEKLKRISPASIDRTIKKDKAALRLKGKSLTKPIDSLLTVV
jgi:hypothetical protein